MSATGPRDCPSKFHIKEGQVFFNGGLAKNMYHRNLNQETVKENGNDTVAEVLLNVLMLEIRHKAQYARMCPVQCTRPAT
jgi:hypothetical protein